MRPPETLPVYRQAPPNEWPELVSFAEDVLGADMDSSKRCQLMLEEIQQLDAERAGANRYYSIGIGLRGLAATLADPATRLPITQEAARRIVEEYNSRQWGRDDTGVALDAIRETPFGIAASASIRESRYQCTSAEIFVGNALFFCAGYEYAASTPIEGRIKAMQADAPNQANIETNSFTGATDIVKAFLGKIAANHTASSNFTLRHIFARHSVQSLRERIPKTTIQRAANLHLDTFAYARTALLIRDNQLHFEKNSIPNKQLATHTTRTAVLGCPARYIQNLMEDAVTTVLEGAELAQSLFEANANR